MKALARTLGLLILSMLVANNSMAQKASFTSNRGLSIGFGAGMAYQTSDLVNSKGYGFDFILGSQLYKKENAFLSVDWKFRFLAGENKAYDHRINPDDTYSNIRYRFFSYDLELGLTLNRLRERTGIVLSVFAGAGITHGRTFTDLYDAENSFYDFSSIDPNLDSKTVYNDLRTLSDGDFETPLVNKAAILPTAGIFLGYQISSSLTIGMEFKTNFYLTEHNSPGGINLDNRDIAGSAIDRNSYVSLGLRWNLKGGSANNRAVSNNSNPDSNTTEIDNTLVPVSLPHPSVTITSPTADSVRTVSKAQIIWATVDHVNGPENISFYQNGFPDHSFTYNTATKILIANLSLRDGENSIRIKATNQTSTAEDLVIITLDEPGEIATHEPDEAAQHKPWTGFTSSSETQINYPSDRTDYTPVAYNPGSGVLNTTVTPINGDDRQMIGGYNEADFESDRTPVTYTKPVVRSSPPKINIISPGTHPLRTYESTEELRATVLNVDSKENITVSMNGINARNFSFSSSTKVLTARVALKDGENVLTINAQNESGRDVRDQVFIKETKPCPLPVIRPLDPVRGQINTTQQIYVLKAEVRNIANSDQLRLTVNGKPVSFSLNNNLLNSSIPLISGLNNISVNAKNECGEDKAYARIRYSPPVTTEPCAPPKVSFALNKLSRDKASHEIRGSISGVKNKADISLTLDGRNYGGFQFVPTTGVLSAKFKLTPTSHTIVVSVKNACGTDSKTVTLSVGEPCTPPTVSLALNKVSRDDATHDIRGSISGVKNKADISLTHNGRAYAGFQFVPTTGALSASLKLTPGSHTIVVTVSNACGKDSKSKSVSVEEEACGLRINPGNAAWQFCLQTPSGTFSRDNLTNKNFSYSGPATSLYFMPIGGGGEVTVKGSPYTIRSGQYYLFTGNINVSVSTKNPGSMGQWSVCIRADREPVSGNGNNRPKSPCEVEKENDIKGNGNSRRSPQARTR